MSKCCKKCRTPDSRIPGIAWHNLECECHLEKDTVVVPGVEEYEWRINTFPYKECPVCGINSFSHIHKKGTKPKDFEKIECKCTQDSLCKGCDKHVVCGTIKCPCGLELNQIARGFNHDSSCRLFKDDREDIRKFIDDAANTTEQRIINRLYNQIADNIKLSHHTKMYQQDTRTNELNRMAVSGQKEPNNDWEKEVWTWITKEMPYKHSDRFIPLFEIIKSLLSQQRESIRSAIYEQVDIMAYDHELCEGCHYGEALRRVLTIVDESIKG